MPVIAAGAGVVEDRELIAGGRSERRAERDVERGTGQVDGAADRQLAVIRAGRGAVDGHVEVRAGVQRQGAGVGQDAEGRGRPG